MECPKCGHQQADTEKCEACDIYFAKYQAIQERLNNGETQRRKGKGRRPAATKDGNGSKLGLIALVVVGALSG